MNVYVLIEEIEYEGESVKGVFANRQMAEQTAASLNADKSNAWRGVSYRVDTWGVTQ